MKKVVILALSLSMFFVNTALAKGPNRGMNSRHVKNVIVLIPDGCNEAVQTLARWYKGDDLALDNMHVGDVKVHMANSIIPGSAAAATSFASGHKTTVKFLGVGPRTDDLLTGLVPTVEPYAPIATVLEAARLKGKATGLVATSRITHATPAAFACHIHSRSLDNEIMEHMVYNNIDVVFGGGFRHLIPTTQSYTTTFGDTWNGKRTDGEDLLQVLLERGYQFVDNKEDMAAVYNGKIWGLFDDSHMEADIDRAMFAEHQPSLAEMTQKAIDLLSQDRDGFFLMVEGSQVDWAGHANDPIYMLTDMLAFDAAVKAACDFADEDGHTLVLAFPDHNTGGMALGQYRNDPYYTAMTIEMMIDPLKPMKITSTGIGYLLNGSLDPDDIYNVVLEQWGIGLSDEEIEEILVKTQNVGFTYALSEVVSKGHTYIGWTSHQHNAETVPLWAYGAGTPGGLVDNTELAEIVADSMGTSLNRTTKRLFVDLDDVNVSWELDVTTDPANPVLKIGGAEIPISKDYMTVNGRTVKLPGVAVHAPMTGKVYVSLKALAVAGIHAAVGN